MPYALSLSLSRVRARTRMAVPKLAINIHTCSLVPKCMFYVSVKPHTVMGGKVQVSGGRKNDCVCLLVVMGVTLLVVEVSVFWFSSSFFRIHTMPYHTMPNSQLLLSLVNEFTSLTLLTYHLDPPEDVLVGYTPFFPFLRTNFTWVNGWIDR
ncbi:hypothetical protein GGS21DRAFT_134601 [Xylaria nigripes]|nr:hypothetical protein GGS21DRAFT_134601 [Xylaria nigripes]